MLTAIAVPLMVLVLGPHLPPGRHQRREQRDQQDANVVLTALLVPIALLVALAFVYSFVNFRQHGEGIVDGPPIKGTRGRTAAVDRGLTSAVVIALAVWGSDS